MTHIELVQLPTLMAFTSGNENIVIVLLDGPVVLDHPDLLLSASASLETSPEPSHHEEIRRHSCSERLRDSLNCGNVLCDGLAYPTNPSHSYRAPGTGVG